MDDLETKQLLRRSIELAEENNDMLHKMRRNSRIQGAFKAFYWLVIIAVSFGSYYYLQPYLQKALALYDQAQSSINAVNSFKSSFGR